MFSEIAKIKPRGISTGLSAYAREYIYFRYFIFRTLHESFIKSVYEFNRSIKTSKAC